VKGMPAEAGSTCALTHNGYRIVGKDIPPVCKLYRRFVAPHVLGSSPPGCEDRVKGMRNLTENHEYKVENPRSPPDEPSRIHLSCRCHPSSSPGDGWSHWSELPTTTLCRR
jgi:hypothetical protein